MTTMGLRARMALLGAPGAVATGAPETWCPLGNISTGRDKRRSPAHVVTWGTGVGTCA